MFSQSYISRKLHIPILTKLGRIFSTHIYLAFTRLQIWAQVAVGMEALAPLREEWRHRRQCGGGRRMPQGGALQVEEEEENNKEEEEDAEPLPASR